MRTTAFLAALLVLAPAARAAEGVQTTEAVGQAPVAGDLLAARDRAKDDALRNCVQQVATTIVTAGTETDQAQLLSDKIYSHSVGYVRRFQILANQTRRSGEGPELFQKIARVCDRFLNVGLEFAGSIPFDDYLRRAVQRQSAVVDAYPACISSIALKNLASKADRWSVPEGARGHLEFFVERMVGAGIGPSTVLQ